MAKRNSHQFSTKPYDCQSYAKQKKKERIPKKRQMIMNKLFFLSDEVTLGTKMRLHDFSRLSVLHKNYGR